MIQLFVNGLTAIWRQKKLILIFWLLNLIIGLIFSLPYKNTFDQFFSHRLISRLLARQNIYTYIAELRYWMADSLAESTTYLRIGAILLFFITLSFTGGIIFSIFQKNFPGFRIFAQKSYYYLWAMVKIGLISPLFGLVAVGLAVITSLPFLLFLPEHFTEYTYFIVFLVWALIGMSWSLVVILFLDIMKVQTVRLNVLRVFEVLKQSRKFLSVNLLKLAGVYLLLYLGLLLIIVFYWQMPTLSGQASGFGIIFDFLALQIVIILLIYVRFSRYAMVTEYLQKRDTIEAH